LAGLWPNERRERELAAEIESNLQMHIDDNLRAGMSPEEARRNALLKLGGIEATKESWRDRNSVPWVETLVQDLRFAVRQLRKNIGFTFTAIFMLGLGICASVAIFAFVDATLIKPLPYKDPNRLVGVYEYTRPCPMCNLSYFDYLDWKKMNRVFQSLDAYRGTDSTLRTSTGTVEAHSAQVSEGFFRTLGIKPAVGRDFYEGEGSPAATRTVLLSYACWKNRFGGKNVRGQTISLSDVTYTIIGVLPADFYFAPVRRAEFWTTLNEAGECEQRRSCHSLYGVARLRDGISVEAAKANAALVAQQLEKQYPGSNLGQGANVVSLSEAIVGNHRTLLLALLSGAGLLLLIACVNVAGLLLVRSESRKRELAVRSALGASRSRLIRQFVTDSVLLVTLGSGVGLLAGRWTMLLLRKLIPDDMLASMPYLAGLGLNARVLGFTAMIALAASVLFAITPALRVSDMREALTEGGRTSAGITWQRLGSRLVVLELAAAMVLLAGAGLFGRSFYRLLQVNIGMRPDHLATLRVAAPSTGYRKNEQQIALERELVRRISSLPGVESVGLCSQLPVSFNGNTDWIRFVGKPYHGEHNEVNERDVSAGYFAAIKAKQVSGRYFREEEDGSKPRVIIINNALARMYFPGEDPVGKRVGNGDLTPNSIREIVGVVDDIREGPLDEPMAPTEYLPFNQDPNENFAVVVRTAFDETATLPSLRAAIHQIDPDIVTVNEASMNAMIHDAPSTYLRRSSAWLAAGFAVAALLIGVVGLYGVVAYSVGQRTREIGVRMALGAQRSTVYALILRQAGGLVALGVALGLVCAVGAAVLIQKLLFGTPAWDAPTLSVTAVVLASAALLASYVPARRAASVNPIDALRAE
jgi:predicted permease